MRIIRKILRFNGKKDEWHLVALGDIHLGHRNVDFELLNATLRFIEQTPNCLWIGMGDYADAITAKDRRFDLYSVDPNFPTPDKQYRRIRELFEPIKDKCIGLLDGNHDYMHWREHNHNYVDDLAYDLKTNYLSMDAYIRLVFERRSGKRPKKYRLDFYAHHGWTNARTTGGRINRITDLANIFPGLPLYLMGHVHLLGPAPPRDQLFVDNRLNVVWSRQYFVFTGSYLKGYMPDATSYVEMKTYVPTTLGSPLITIKIDDSGPNPIRLRISELP